MPRSSGESKYCDVKKESKFADEDEDDVIESKFDHRHGGEGKRSESNKADVMAKAAKYCFSPDFIGIFQRYIEENAYQFFDTVDSGDEEHKLEYMDLFKDYLSLYETTMEDWLSREGLTLKEFNEALQEAQEVGDSSQKHFIKLLVASGEYDCFYDVMLGEAKRQRAAEK